MIVIVGGLEYPRPGLPTAILEIFPVASLITIAPAVACCEFNVLGGADIVTVGGVALEYPVPGLETIIAVTT